MKTGRTRTSTVNGNWEHKTHELFIISGPVVCDIVNLYVSVYLYCVYVHVFLYFMYLLFVLVCMLN